jgi:ABC-type tungstate transport system substrate-binding protein
MDAITTTLLSLGGVIIGALLQFLLSRKGKKDEYFLNLRYEAYKDYIKAVAIIAASQSESEMATVHSKLADAKARIAIFGSKKAVQSIAELEKIGAVLIKPEALSAFENIIKEMRGPNNKADDGDIKMLLFGNKE